MRPTIELRGHHLDSIAGLYLVPLDEHIQNLISREYILNANDPFVDVSYTQIKGLFENPSQKILLVAEKPDFICKACRKIGSCFDENLNFQPPKVMIGPAFKPEEAIREKNDWGVAEKYGFIIGDTYTTKEIRERVEF